MILLILRRQEGSGWFVGDDDDIADNSHYYSALWSVYPISDISGIHITVLRIPLIVPTSPPQHFGILERIKITFMSV